MNNQVSKKHSMCQERIKQDLTQPSEEKIPENEGDGQVFKLYRM